jgi:hypothetical protein
MARELRLPFIQASSISGPTRLLLVRRPPPLYQSVSLTSSRALRHFFPLRAGMALSAVESSAVTSAYHRAILGDVVCHPILFSNVLLVLPQVHPGNGRSAPIRTRAGTVNVEPFQLSPLVHLRFALSCPPQAYPARSSGFPQSRRQSVLVLLFVFFFVLFLFLLFQFLQLVGVVPRGVHRHLLVELVLDEPA